MATPIGTNEINSISRRYIYPTLVDNFYKSNLLFFRANMRNKKVLQGGLQIEVPLVYQGFAAGGAYQGFDLLDVSPSDTVKNGAWDWKQFYVPVSVDGLTLIRSDSPEAVVNFLSFYFEQAQTDLADRLGTALWQDPLANTKNIDNLHAAIDDGTYVTTYGGLSRSANTWWKCAAIQKIGAATALTLANIQTTFGNTVQGGRHPTIMVTDQFTYNIYWSMFAGGSATQTTAYPGAQLFPVQPAGQDEQLASAGFTNLLFNNVPLVVDSHIAFPAADTNYSNGSHGIFMINEDYMYLFVNPRADFAMKEFREPINQDAMTSLILWAGNLVFSNCARQGKITSINS